jgi:hypothetical protein
MTRCFFLNFVLVLVWHLFMDLLRHLLEISLPSSLVLCIRLLLGPVFLCPPFIQYAWTRGWMPNITFQLAQVVSGGRSIGEFAVACVAQTAASLAAAFLLLQVDPAILTEPKLVEGINPELGFAVEVTVCNYSL